MPPLNTPPHFQLVLRLTALGVQVGFAFSMALVVADIASQLATPAPASTLVRTRGWDCGVGVLADVGLDLEAGGDRVAGVLSLSGATDASVCLLRACWTAPTAMRRPLTRSTAAEL